MSDNTNYKIHGDDMQAVEITLSPAESVRAETGTMLYMEEGIEMQTNAEGGIFKGIKRMFTGESFFITSFTNNSNTQRKVAFAAPYPGKITALDLASLGGEFLCQRDSFLCGSAGIDVDVAFTKRLGAGFFGGEGFILQKLSGSGLAFVHAGGTVIEYDLQQGEKLHVDTGCLVAFSPSVAYDIAMMKGFKNVLFGGEGLFLAHLTGPGKVLLQSLPFSKMADRILSAAGGNRESSKGIGGIGGDIVSGFLSGD